MTVIARPQDFNANGLYVDLRATFGHGLFLKCEGFNFAGSIKLKTANEMVEAAERDGVLGKDSILVESSSGNLGVALSIIAADRGYGFICITDARCNASTRRLMQALGAQVHTVTAGPNTPGGLLGARIDYVRKLCASSNRYVWLNQYANPNNWKAHFRTTAQEITRDFPNLDVLFVGAGTTGTLMGCARYLREWKRRTRVVAVDAVGSVTFGAPPARRLIPGLGTAVRPQQLDELFIDEVMFVEEPDTIRACHQLASRGFLFGGSTGTVVSGAVRWLDENGWPDVTSVAISPDLGERYLETVYDTAWLEENFGEDVLVAEDAPGLGEWTPSIRAPGKDAPVQAGER